MSEETTKIADDSDSIDCLAGSLSDLASIYLEECHVSGDSMINMDHSIDDLPDRELGAFYVADLMAGFVERIMKENERVSRKRECTGSASDDDHYLKVLEYIVKYGDRVGIKRAVQVCAMTLRGINMFNVMRIQEEQNAKNQRQERS